MVILEEGLKTFDPSKYTFPDSIKFLILVLEKLEFKYCSPWPMWFNILKASMIHLSILCCGRE